MSNVAGSHFNCYLKLDIPIGGEYFYDDIHTNGYAQLRAGESKIKGRHKLSLMIFLSTKVHPHFGEIAVLFGLSTSSNKSSVVVSSPFFIVPKFNM